MPAALRVRPLSDAEVAALRRLERTTRDASIRTRCLMLLHSHAGLTPPAIGRVLGRSPDTVRRAIRRYEQAGMPALADGDPRRRPPAAVTVKTRPREIRGQGARVARAPVGSSTPRAVASHAAWTIGHQADANSLAGDPTRLDSGAWRTRAAETAERPPTLPTPDIDDRAADVGHELRSPLATILGFAQLLASAPPGSLDPVRQATFVAAIADAGQYMLQLIDDLLDLRRMESGVEPLRFSELEVAPFLAGAVLRFRSLADEKGIATSLEADPGLPPIVTDELLVRRALDNLLSNAIKYTPAGGSVRLTASRDGNGVAIAVTDTGIGLTESEQVRVFERFYRGSRRETRSERGSGLGLALVRGAARRLGGEVRVASAVGRGSAFTLWLPFRHAEAPATDDTAST